ncbi:Frag1/DRAM/Sfk1 family-domain-containing protein [Rhodotorula diobovata]|uniref:Frag1/DRAM/Sfk1 family-domain-containing protein n=1 Tax=Rhodotorula diobovata TaxID=5288 RepID=A0A5C5G5W3_9BASI|nr:Frag1/DRAM/Sfk1 family-domain-containing protein [Rhodotorula diobovata]
MKGPVVNVPQGRRIRYNSLWWMLPTMAVLCWFSLILGLLLWWAIDDNAKQYQVEQATIVYVSNIGAAHQWLFIFLGSMTAVFYILSLLAERWLRHLRRIPGPLRKRDRNADIAACVFGICGGIALILLTCFNAVTHSTGHWTCTAIFVVCIALSALCQTLELHWLHQDHVDRKHLRRNAILKWIIVGTAVAAAIAFGATYGVCAGSEDGVPLSPKCNRVKSAAACLEWLIAILYGVYLITFGLDLWPASKTVGHKFDERLIEEDRNNTLHFHKRASLPGAPGGIGLNGTGHGNGADVNNATLDAVESGTARPSESTMGEYGAYARQPAGGAVAQPEMAHVQGMNGHGPVTREAY